MLPNSTLQDLVGAGVAEGGEKDCPGPEVACGAAPGAPLLKDRRPHTTDASNVVKAAACTLLAGVNL